MHSVTGRDDGTGSGEFESPDGAEAIQRRDPLSHRPKPGSGNRMRTPAATTAVLTTHRRAIVERGRTQISCVVASEELG
jgi:hypothetical protein